MTRNKIIDKKTKMSFTVLFKQDGYNKKNIFSYSKSLYDLRFIDIIFCFHDIIFYISFLICSMVIIVIR